MSSKLTYRKRFIYLLVGSLVLLWLVYYFAIKETLRIRSEYNETKFQVETVGNAKSKVLFYNKEIKKIDSLLDEDSFYTQDILLEKILEFGRDKNLIIINFPKPHIYLDKSYSYLTYKAEIEGGFRDLLELVNKLETEKFPAKIKSVRFELVKNPGNKKQNLILTLYIMATKVSQPDNKEKEKK